MAEDPFAAFGLQRKSTEQQVAPPTAQQPVSINQMQAHAASVPGQQFGGFPAPAQQNFMPQQPTAPFGQQPGAGMLAAPPPACGFGTPAQQPGFGAMPAGFGGVPGAQPGYGSMPQGMQQQQLMPQMQQMPQMPQMQQMQQIQQIQQIQQVQQIQQMQQPGFGGPLQQTAAQVHAPQPPSAGAFDVSSLEASLGLTSPTPPPPQPLPQPAHDPFSPAPQPPQPQPADPFAPPPARVALDPFAEAADPFSNPQPPADPFSNPTPPPPLAPAAEDDEEGETDDANTPTEVALDTEANAEKPTKATVLSRQDTFRYLDELANGTAQVKVDAARALKSLAFNANGEYKDGLLRGGVPRLLMLMVTDASSVAALEQATSCMYSLAREHVESKTALVKVRAGRRGGALTPRKRVVARAWGHARGATPTATGAAHASPTIVVHTCAHDLSV